MTYINTRQLSFSHVLHLNVRNWNDVYACSLCRTYPIFRPDNNSVLLALVLPSNVQRQFNLVCRRNNVCLLGSTLGLFGVVQCGKTSPVVLHMGFVRLWLRYKHRHCVWYCRGQSRQEEVPWSKRFEDDSVHDASILLLLLLNTAKDAKGVSVKRGVGAGVGVGVGVIFLIFF